jgi:hypothetical protein
MNTHAERVIEYRNKVEVIPGTDIPVHTRIDGERLIAEVEAFITRYVVLPSAARLPVALWAITTHLFDSFDAFPYLNLSSPTPRCGKTRLLEVLELIVARPWRGTAPTEAALFRFIEANQPTLLLDEVEGLSKRHASDRDTAVLAILNAGYKRGQTVPRCVGNSHELQNFRVYCPKAFAAIGHLPATLADRSIVIQMQRRSPGESVARFRFERARREVGPTRLSMERAVKAFAGEIQKTYSELPELTFLSDRDEEIFSPLFAVCAVLAPGRVRELEKSAKKLCDVKAGDALDDSLGLRLIHDMASTWPEGQAACLTKGVLESLSGIEDAPWKSEHELNPRRLARMLRPFEVLPRQVRTVSSEGKGYLFAELKRAISRYPAPERETSETTRMNTE